MLKLPALALGLAFAIAQAVVVADCPCGSFCSLKNACPGGNAAGERCYHFEPQADLLEGAPTPDLRI